MKIGIEKVKQELEKQKPAVMRFEDSLKAKAKLNLLEKRYDMILAFEQYEPVIGADGKPELDEKGKPKFKTIPNEAIDVMKMSVISTQALGEIGDKYPLGKKAMKAWKKLQELYFDSLARNGDRHPLTQELRVRVYSAFISIMNRSIRREHTDIEFVLLPPEISSPLMRDRQVGLSK